MKISTKGRYGLKAMVELAKGKDERCVSLKFIAQRHGISESYLEQIIAPLKKAGFVKSVRGAGGGYVLSKQPENITSGDILRVLEGNLAPVDCLHDDEATCGNSDCSDCSTKLVFSKLFQSVNDVVDSITLYDLANEKGDNNG